MLALAVAAAWAAFQPVRAVHAGDVGDHAAARARSTPPPTSPGSRHDRNPLSVEPLWELAAIEEGAGALAGRRDALEQAVELQPSSAETWRRLGPLPAQRAVGPGGARRSFRAAYFLDPRNPASTSDLLEARRAAGDPAPAAPPEPAPEP